MTTPSDAKTATAVITSASPCPCGSGKTYGQCCEPIILRKVPAPTAEALMRSRYTAHVVRNYKHLHLSYSGTVKVPFVEEGAEENYYNMDWTRLVIHSHETNLGGDPDAAMVDFSAFFRELKDKTQEHALQEKAAFQRINGEWLYTRAVRNGPAPVVSATPKVGRNDPCPCGSGKKYKHCCMK